MLPYCTSLHPNLFDMLQADFECYSGDQLLLLNGLQYVKALGSCALPRQLFFSTIIRKIGSYRKSNPE